MKLGPSGETTWLRIVKRTGDAGVQFYTAYTSNDRAHWTRVGPGATRLATKRKSESRRKIAAAWLCSSITSGIIG